MGEPAEPSDRHLSAVPDPPRRGRQRAEPPALEPAPWPADLPPIPEVPRTKMCEDGVERIVPANRRLIEYMNVRGRWLETLTPAQLDLVVELGL